MCIGIPIRSAQMIDHTLLLTIEDDPVANLVGIEDRLEEEDDLGSLGDIVDVDQMSDTAPDVIFLDEAEQFGRELVE